MPPLSGVQEEFVTLIESVGWRAADAARALNVAKMTVSRYINDQDPPPRIMLLLRRLVAEEAARLQTHRSNPLLFEQSRPDASAALAELKRIDDLIESLRSAKDRLRHILARRPFVPDTGMPDQSQKYPNSNLPADLVEEASNAISADEAALKPKMPIRMPKKAKWPR